MMIRKMPTTVLLSAVLVITSLTTMAMPTFNANITNFPLDDEGNLKVTQTDGEPSSITMVFNQTLTIPSQGLTMYNLTSFDSSGFNYAYVMAKARGTWEERADIYIYLYENNFGVQTLPHGVGCIKLDCGAESYKPSWGTGKIGYELHSSSNDIYLQVAHSNVGFNGLLTIVVHLSN